MVSDTFFANPTGEHIQRGRGHQHREFRSPEPSERQKRVPSAKKCVKNAYPQPKSASKTRTLSPKVRPQDLGERQKHVPSAKKCVKNAYPQPESPSIFFEKNMSRPDETNKCSRKQAWCGRLRNIKLAKTRTRRVFLRSSRPPAARERPAQRVQSVRSRHCVWRSNAASWQRFWRRPTGLDSKVQRLGN